MPYNFTVKKIFTKYDDDNWSGLALRKFGRVDTTHDPRDDEGRDNNYVRNVKKEHFNQQSKFINLPWDREYVSDNTLIIKTYFDTEQDAKDFYLHEITYRFKIPVPSSSTPTEGYSVAPEGLTRYKITWEIEDVDNNLIELPTE